MLHYIYIYCQEEYLALVARLILHVKDFSKCQHFHLVIIIGYFSIGLSINVSCGYSLELPCQGDSNEYPQHIFFYGEIIPKLSSLPVSLISLPTNKMSHLMTKPTK